ncbi:MAG: STAS/SEC14 domain-containing protein [Bacteroidales bacterium]|nr:STAS/SEC14 domain-containing protein [Bacteroidales bacterium]
MIKIVPESKKNVLIAKAEGKLTNRDYTEILIPRLEFIINNYGKARLLLDMGDQFQGWQASALWDDTRFGLTHKNSFEKMGVIGGPIWIDWGMKIISLMISGEIKSFPIKDRQKAMDWIVT